ncbi:hypothetical protein JNW88_09910 [Micromonospora sp. ATA32]|nr:hypothetical protein [Micromonospora sp. ATA32]
MDADETAAVAVVPLEGGLLGVGQDVAGGVQEDHGPELLQVRLVELPRVVGDLDRETAVAAELLDGRYPGRRGGVRAFGGPGEDEHLVLDAVAGGCRRGECWCGLCWRGLRRRGERRGGQGRRDERRATRVRRLR